MIFAQQNDNYDDCVIESLTDLFRFIEIELRSANKLYTYKELNTPYTKHLPHLKSEWLRIVCEKAYDAAKSLSNAEPRLSPPPLRSVDNVENLVRLRDWCFTSQNQPIRWSRPMGLKELAKIFDRHPNTIRRWIDEGTIKSRHVADRNWRIPQEEMPYDYCPENFNL
ncbi:helix-turn-helix domain-containing protein [Candidatus Pacearchaeota archaeon]|nr:helix-turn-helix domain-containing protein [Candidatus Pacearchaeota archaeon]